MPIDYFYTYTFSAVITSIKSYIAARICNDVIQRKRKSTDVLDSIHYCSISVYDNNQKVIDEEYDVHSYNCYPPPIFIPLITLTEISIFTYYVIELANNDNPTDDVTAYNGWPIKSSLNWNPKARDEVWRYLTYIFIHNGYFHLLSNVIIQLCLGLLLELEHKWLRVGAVYMLGVLAGSLTHSCFDALIPLVGSSAGCYALIGAKISCIIACWSKLQSNWLASPIHFIASGVFGLTTLIMLISSDTILALFNRCNVEQRSHSRVGFYSHFGGLIAGILTGTALLRQPVNLTIKICGQIALFIYILLAVIAILYNILGIY